MSSKDYKDSKDRIRIVITDSGLGGLLIQALLDKKLRALNLSAKAEPGKNQNAGEMDQCSTLLYTLYIQ